MGQTFSPANDVFAGGHFAGGPIKCGLLLNAYWDNDNATLFQHSKLRKINHFFKSVYTTSILMQTISHYMIVISVIFSSVETRRSPGGRLVRHIDEEFAKLIFWFTAR